MFVYNRTTYSVGVDKGNGSYDWWNFWTAESAQRYIAKQDAEKAATAHVCGNGKTWTGPQFMAASTY